MSLSGGTRRACVVGAGMGGLALAIRLQAAGVATTLIEARPSPGGRAWSREEQGFTFCSGPLALAAPAALAELWALTGDDLAADVNLLPIEPLLRCTWPDGAAFDLLQDEAAQGREVARFAPGDLAGFEEWQRFGQSLRDDLPAGMADLQAAARAAPLLLRHQAWRSLHGAMAHHMRSQRLCDALSVTALLSGANPFTASALLAASQAEERQGGLFWPEGGMGRLAQAMQARFEKLGGTTRLHDPVLHVHTLGNRASEIETQSGWRERFDAVASNADLVHTYRDLLGECPRGGDMARNLTRRRFAPGMFAVHFAVEGTWPGLPHRMVLFGQRYRSLIEDIFDHGVLPQDMLIFLSHPTVTDPGLAPPGKSVFQALVPVAHLGKLPIDWETVGPMLEQRVMAEIGRRLIPDLPDRIVRSFHVTPRDYALDLNAHAGSAFSLESAGAQLPWQRASGRDGKLANFYLVGSATHPGAGLPAVLESARQGARTMLEDMK